MQLNELIQKETLDTIAGKTNLTREVILRLVDRNCKALRRAQAMGAISIIEREYGTRLPDLRKECEDYFATVKPVKREGESEIVRPLAEEKRSYTKPVSLLILVLLASGAWYFFGTYYHNKVRLAELQIGKFFPDNNMSDGTASSDSNGSERNSSSGEAALIVESDTMEGNSSGIGRENGSGAEDDNLTRSLPYDPQRDMNASRKSTEAQPENSMPKDHEKREKSAKEVSGDLQERKLITILPEQKMWFRVTNVDTKRSREFKREEKYEVVLGGHDWLFASQDSNFSIIDRNMLDEYHLKGKLFLRFDQKGVHILSEKEYRSLVK